MNYCINIEDAATRLFHPLPENNSKGWSYSSVYYIEELKDLYVLINKESGFNSIDSLCDLFNDLYNENDRKKTKRQILENVNALKNFGLLSKEGKPLKGILFQAKFGEALTKEDKEVFVNIYLQYFRFREFHNFFVHTNSITLDDLQNHSMMILTAISSGRFTNLALFTKDGKTEVIKIANEYPAAKRFWDVYFKWGVKLDLLEKFPIKQVGITTYPNVKSLQAVYFKKKMANDFSVFEYLKSNFRETYIYIPDAIYCIAKDFRYSLDEIKQKLLNECMNRDEYRAQSTSSFYIEKKENFLFPKLGNTYITHLLKI